MVVEDCKRTHVCVPKGLITRWMPHLKEFKMFRITNLMVIDLKMKPRLRTIPCNWYLGFSHRTTVEPLETPLFPCNPFRFKRFSEHMDENIVLQNDIFEVVGKEDPRDVVTNTRWEIKRMVVVLQDTDNDWCYNACAGRKKKVYTRDGTSSNGKHCTIDTGERVDRYKIEVIATDDTGCINLLLWDREAKILCGNPAIEAEDDYPKILNNMLDRQLLIMINVRNNNINEGDPIYPVIKVIDDLEVIGKCTSVKDPIDVQENVDVNYSMHIYETNSTRETLSLPSTATITSLSSMEEIINNAGRNNRNKRIPCSAIDFPEGNDYYFRFHENEDTYYMLQDLADKLGNVVGNYIWFVDDADNCVPVRINRVGNTFRMSGEHIVTLRSQSAPHEC
ncbi:hypothetical protein PIB30_014310 [Stylosanthes scabra]|uniref:Replication factor A C-terminal domain-containing protein n=1 Tax=Stylosanthes scabra TaxID=79078 RepID=A0ABU6Q6K5_9FABA|nr:hypothetical protein [Stylosanthes scabra]